MSMTANDVLTAIRRHHSDCAIVPEISINDLYAREQPEGRKPVFMRRIDALMFDGHQRTAIEIKVDKADLRNETWFKTAPWRAVTHRFIVAVPAGMAEFHEIEAHYGCGLWWIHPDGKVEVKRKAIVNKFPEPLPNDVIRRLAYRASGVPMPEEKQKEEDATDLIGLLREAAGVR